VTDPDGERTSAGTTDAAATGEEETDGIGNTEGIDTDARAGEEGWTEDAEAADVLDDLFTAIEEREETRPEGSYTASLFDHEKGENAVLEKLGEETTELVLAAKDDDREALLAEASDLVYHLLVLLAMEGASLDELRAELRTRRE
jgi:phosphoribosyl-ATP pyrophosphohydrolase